MASLCETFLILVSLQKTQILIFIFLNVAQYTCYRKLQSSSTLCFSFPKYMTSLSINGFLVWNFAYFGFALQTQILIFIFLNEAQNNCFQKPKSSSTLYFSFREYLTSLSIHGFLVWNFAYFVFAPQTLYLFFLM